MYTNKYGRTHINEALEVVSVETRISWAFAKEGISPSPTMRDKARILLTNNPMLTADQAVGYVLHKMDAWSNPRTGGGRDVAKYGTDSKPTYERDLRTMLIPNNRKA